MSRRVKQSPQPPESLATVRLHGGPNDGGVGHIPTREAKADRVFKVNNPHGPGESSYRLRDDLTDADFVPAKGKG